MKRNVALVWLCAALLQCIALVLALRLSEVRKDDERRIAEVRVEWTERDASKEAYAVLSKMMEKELLSPGTAEYPDEWSEHVRRDGQTYVVDSYVDSQGRYRYVCRTKFIGKVMQVAEGEWKVDKFDYCDW